MHTICDTCGEHVRNVGRLDKFSGDHFLAYVCTVCRHKHNINHTNPSYVEMIEKLMTRENPFIYG